MNATIDCEVEELLRDIVHDVRQPLGTIGTSSYMLSLWLHDAPDQVRDQIRMIQRQVDSAQRILTDASAHLRRLQAQPVAGESFDLTNSETALVT